MHDYEKEDRPLLFPIMSLAAFIGSLVVNYAFASDIGDTYRMKITPPGIFFAIWGLIYISTGIVLVYVLITRQWSNNTHIWMTLVSVFNAAWIGFTSAKF